VGIPPGLGQRASHSRGSGESQGRSGPLSAPRVVRACGRPEYRRAAPSPSETAPAESTAGRGRWLTTPSRIPPERSTT
jgi:hypothetical protein